ncbi:MAG TPA: hypothetical protein VF581_13740 [Flavobacterium sp.]
MKTIFSLLIVGSLVLTSCRKDLEPQESSTTLTTTSAETAAATPSTPGVASQPQQQMQQNPAMTTTTTTTQTAPPPVAVAKGMNPSHGQPGHRCDIAVGAPLNSPAKTNPGVTPQVTPGGSAPIKISPTTISSNGTVTPGSNTSVTTSNNSAPAILQAPGAATPAGMNPPHGAAGHRCDVAVGAALPK